MTGIELLIKLEKNLCILLVSGRKRMRSMITVSVDGNFSKTERFFERIKELGRKGKFDKYGEMGVKALASATPKDTGLTSDSWTYVIEHRFGKSSIVWSNTNTNDGVNIVILIQYGHGFKNGGYVQGRDFINPAIQPVFDKIADDAWKEVTRV